MDHRKSGSEIYHTETGIEIKLMETRDNVISRVIRPVMAGRVMEHLSSEVRESERRGKGRERRQGREEWDEERKHGEGERSKRVIKRKEIETTGKGKEKRRAVEGKNEMGGKKPSHRNEEKMQ